MQRDLYPDDIPGNKDQRLPHAAQDLMKLFEETKEVGKDLAEVMDVVSEKVVI